MRAWLRVVLPVLLVAAVVAAPLPAAAQCSMCKTALTNSDEGRAISAEFNRAILLMLFAPYLLMATAAGYLLRGRIRLLAGRALARVRPAVLRG